MTTHTVDSLMELADAYAVQFARDGNGDVSDEQDLRRDHLEHCLREFQRQEFNRGVEAAALVCAPKYAAPLAVGKTHSGSIMSCGCSTYTDSDGVTTSMKCAMHAVLAIKETP
jgi:hypothetical protein